MADTEGDGDLGVAPGRNGHENGDGKAVNGGTRNTRLDVASKPWIARKCNGAGDRLHVDFTEDHRR